MVKKRKTGYLIQDAGLVLFLLCIGTMCFAVGNTEGQLFFEFIIMLLMTFFAVLLAGFRLNSLAVIVTGMEIFGYCAYKVYFFYSHSDQIEVLCYIWLILPVMSVAAMILFVYGSRQTELENEILKGQVEELVLINPLTGLYNLRSMYNDLQRQAAYARRNKLDMCLMLIELRYESELKSILSRQAYESLLQKMAQIIEDTIRVEDRSYSIDNKGGIGVILTCDREGSEFVKNRIRFIIESKDTFTGIVDSAIKVEVRMACLEYEEELFGNDMMLFKQKIESELQYDV